jgi:hypothetical protein
VKELMSTLATRLCKRRKLRAWAYVFGSHHCKLSRKMIVGNPKLSSTSLVCQMCSLVIKRCDVSVLVLSGSCILWAEFLAMM